MIDPRGFRRFNSLPSIHRQQHDERVADHAQEADERADEYAGEDAE